MKCRGSQKISQPKVLRVLKILLLFFVFTILQSSGSFAATLDGANDFINGNLPEQEDIEHNIGFLIPKNTGHAIVATDYIIITFTNYTDITLPTDSQGWSSGTPAYSLDGRRVLITGVTAPTGAGITITGITATNPAAGQSDFITIQTANNALGSIIYDQAVISPTIFKESVHASVTIDQIVSSLEFTGYTSPNAFVTVRLNGAVAGTTIADSNGFYNKKITGLTPNLNYAVSIFAHDTNEIDSKAISLSVLTLPNINFLVSDIVIPTTINIDKDNIYEGDTMKIYGMCHPYSQVSLWIGKDMDHALTLQAGSSGYWEYRYNTYGLPLDPGPHKVFAQEIVTGGFTSIFTDKLNFNINQCRIADLNCDTHVNLTDFSIMMYYWNKVNPTNRRADINQDTKVNETDFSLLMYYWTD